MQLSFSLGEPDETELEIRETLQLCSYLLEYPALDEDPTLIQRQIKELKNTSTKEVLQSFWVTYQSKDFIERAEAYVATFDFNPSTSLYLTVAEENQKESNRGLSLLQLKEVYKQNSLQLQGNELPDYLPAFLEFLSLAPLSLIQMALKRYGPALEKLASELRKAESPYSLVMDTCQLALSALLEPKEVSL